MTVNQRIADATTLQRLRLLQYEGGVVDQIVRAYLRRMGPIMAELTAIAGRMEGEGYLFSATDRARLLSLQREIDVEVRLLHDEIRSVLQQAMPIAQRAEQQFLAVAFRTAIPARLGADVAVAPLADLAQALLTPIGGLRWTDRLAVDLLDVHDRLVGAIGEAVSSGASMDRAARMIQDATGLTETYKGRLVAIARTEIQRVSNEAALATYRQNTDVIKGVQYLATLDSRTCLTCAPYHGQVFTFAADGSLPDAPAIPQHPRCRCFYSPVTRSWDELGLASTAENRRELDGREGDKSDFESWLKRQPAKTQTEVLGKSNRERWLSGTALADL